MEPSGSGGEGGGRLRDKVRQGLVCGPGSQLNDACCPLTLTIHAFLFLPGPSLTPVQVASCCC